MSTSHYILTVPVTYENGGTPKTSFRRVGAVFENQRRETGEIFLSIKLDYPVGVTELVAFPPKTGEEIDEGGA